MTQAAPNPAGEPPPPAHKPCQKHWLRLKRYLILELYRKLTVIETLYFTFIALCVAAILFGLPIMLAFAANDNNTIKELLKGLQFVAKILGFGGGVLAFLENKALNRYTFGLFFAAFAIDFGVDTFIYYSIESTLPHHLRMIFWSTGVMLQVVGIGGIVLILAILLQNFFGLGWRFVTKRSPL